MGLALRPDIANGVQPISDRSRISLGRAYSNNVKPMEHVNRQGHSATTAEPKRPSYVIHSSIRLATCGLRFLSWSARRRAADETLLKDIKQPAVVKSGSGTTSKPVPETLTCVSPTAYCFTVGRRYDWCSSIDISPLHPEHNLLCEAIPRHNYVILGQQEP
jgi:hypothetical protein